MFENHPHGGIHHSIGGDMDQTWSSNDPLFWIHHAFVDKVWWNWQQTHPNANGYNGRTFNGRLASTSDALPALGLRVSQVLNIHDLCYTYSNSEQDGGDGGEDDEDGDENDRGDGDGDE
ncbi:Di-copper centre-containing protein [Basidiobolus meristosporus CBS 931.73]|uniref:Di-copper centre-containing protein n=1 Tax=Basidiobolus meristosporus CBS 931.73 TaxID=1314790 RepID=A0A1Y1XVN2_9FUNG|nr:Di-copper centre-containing protein [Basidiobolus meristosporus CBS 931.73]|eukprot:ORX89820.1 Di-copper centre-containing protein [Basidiobolus meristosporus CBS 931.73]